MNHVEILMTVGGGCITLLLVIIGFFLRQHIEVVKELIKSVNILSKVVAVLENNGKNLVLGCNEKHFSITTRLKTHGERLDDIDVEIGKIQTQLKIEGRIKK